MASPTNYGADAYIFVRGCCFFPLAEQCAFRALREILAVIGLVLEGLELLPKFTASSRVSNFFITTFRVWPSAW